jgi:Tfp pilus assembly protein PilN
MKSAQLNLAREPFVNFRPIRRLTWILWVIAALLLTANTVFYWRFFSGQEHRTDLLEELEAGIAREQAEIARLEQELDGLDLDAQNQRAVFLNSRISQRIFSWSHLFDRLAEVLPEDVHLNRVSPRIDWSGSAGRSGKSTAAADERVHLGVTGVAKSDTALLALIDGLFSHPSFVRPDLSREARKSQQQFDFSLDVIYLPGRFPGPVAEVDQQVGGLEMVEDLLDNDLPVVPEDATEIDDSTEGDA